MFSNHPCIGRGLSAYVNRISHAHIAYLYTLGLQLLEDRLHVKWCVILSIVHGAANKQLIKDPMRYVDQVIRS